MRETENEQREISYAREKIKTGPSVTVLKAHARQGSQGRADSQDRHRPPQGATRSGGDLLARPAVGLSSFPSPTARFRPFSPHLPALPTVFCGCARPCPIENRLTARKSRDWSQPPRLPGRGGAYRRVLTSIRRPTEVLCCCRKWEGEGCDGGCGFNREGKCRRLYPGDFVGATHRGRQGREVEEMPGCWDREE